MKHTILLVAILYIIILNSLAIALGYKLLGGHLCLCVVCLGVVYYAVKRSSL